MLVKNRGAGALQTPLVGPYTFVKYKDWDKYACILEDEVGHQFDCSVAHLVPVSVERVARRAPG